MENQFTNGILLGSGLKLRENMGLGALSYHIETSGRFVHQINSHLIFNKIH